VSGSEEERLPALVALLRAGGRAWTSYVIAARRVGDARAIDPRGVLADALGLLSFEAEANAAAEIAGWQRRGYRLLALSDPGYPANLRVVEGRPPLLFVAGQLRPEDANSVAVIGTRRPSEQGLELTRELATGLAAAGHTVVSGLAAGVDREAHVAALGARRRTVAVLGNGLDHAYPPENIALQRQIARQGALVSQFWPESRPARQSFPARNAVMSGLTLASVIVEAGEHSGTRIQARHALAQGRAVVLMEPVLRNRWGRELAQRPGVLVAGSAAEAVGLLRR
jgi:DNA processing protein